MVFESPEICDTMPKAIEVARSESPTPKETSGLSHPEMGVFEGTLEKGGVPLGVPIKLRIVAGGGSGKVT